MNPNEAIQQLAETTGRDEQELEDDFERLKAEEDEKGVSNPAKRALRRLSLEVKGTGGGSADSEEMVGIVYGASDPINTSQSAIRRAKQFINKSGVQQAIDLGLVKKVPGGADTGNAATLSITPADGDPFEVAVLDDNDSSPTSGEVLPSEDYIRYVYGAVFRSPGDEPKWFSAVMDGDDPADVPEVPPTNEPVKFAATWIGESDRNNTIRLRFPDEDAFETVEEGPDPVALLDDGGQLGHTPLSEADADRYDRNDVFATYGSVTYMELAPDPGQSRRLSLVDPFDFQSDLERTVWLPDHVEINFAEDSDVFVIGQASESNNDYPDSVEAVGVLPHPDYVVDRSNIEEMAEQDTAAAADAETDTAADTAPEGGDGVSGGQTDGGGDAEAPDDPDFETGATIEDSEQAEAAEEGAHVPSIVESAGYSDLQTVAAQVDEVPGSGISEDEMRQRLVEARSGAWVAGKLADVVTDADFESEDGDDEPDGDDADPEPADPAAATTDGGETEGPFEEEEADKEWDW
jgi:hypothetical protein